MRRVHLCAAALVAIAALPACARSDGSASTTAAVDDATGSSASVEITAALPITSDSTTSTSAPALPDSPARDRVEWLVELINTRSTDVEAIKAGFSPDFLASFPIEQIAGAISAAVGGDTGWAISDEKLEQFEGSATLTSEQGGVVSLDIAVDKTLPFVIEALQLQPELPVVFPPDEVIAAADIDRELGVVAERFGWGAFDVTDGECSTVTGTKIDQALPIGSAYKLWILAALATEIEAGRAAWDEPLAVNPDWLSSSDGQISPLAPGTEVTLLEYATAMISISDNSATDHLLGRLGREAVEQAMAASGIADTAANTPMLSTRELFLIKWGTALTAEEYVAADTETRRRLLDERLGGVSLQEGIDPAADTTSPTDVETIEWFATPAEMCTTMLWLDELSKRPGLEPIIEVLTQNPGMPFGPDVTEARYKGGSEAGVVFTDVGVGSTSRDHRRRR